MLLCVVDCVIHYVSHECPVLTALPCCRPPLELSLSLFCSCWSLGVRPSLPTDLPKAAGSPQQDAPFARPPLQLVPGAVRVPRPALRRWRSEDKCPLFPSDAGGLAARPGRSLQGRHRRTDPGAAEVLRPAGDSGRLLPGTEVRAGGRQHGVLAARRLGPVHQAGHRAGPRLPEEGAQGKSGLDHMALGAGTKQVDSAALQAWARESTGGAKVAQLSNEPQPQNWSSDPSQRSEIQR